MVVKERLRIFNRLQILFFYLAQQGVKKFFKMFLNIL